MLFRSRCFVAAAAVSSYLSNNSALAPFDWAGSSEPSLELEGGLVAFAKACCSSFCTCALFARSSFFSALKYLRVAVLSCSESSSFSLLRRSNLRRYSFCAASSLVTLPSSDESSGFISPRCVASRSSSVSALDLSPFALSCRWFSNSCRSLNETLLKYGGPDV